MMNIYLVAVLVIIIGHCLLDLLIERLNLGRLSAVLPEEFSGYFSAEKYSQAQAYLKAKTNLTLLKDTVMSAILLVFILSGGFNLTDKFARSFHLGPILTGLIFAAVLMLAVQLLDIPFSAYHTFVLEERFGFNRTTIGTFILDIVKGLFLGALLGGIAFAVVLWFFSRMGSLAWVYCWLALTLFQLFLLFIAPVAILPLFNKFIPLEESELKQAINQYAQAQGVQLKGILKMDASHRSTKTNAFFIGFGRYRRIALYDTLIAAHTPTELVSVLAHEVGHYRKRHILKRLAVSFCTTGLMFFILSLFVHSRGLFAAFRMEERSVYAGIFFFAFLYAPINLVFCVFGNLLARRQEYAADAYAVSTYQHPEAFISALKKLSVENLSNLTPHPLKVFFYYSHPPALNRIEAIKSSL